MNAHTAPEQGKQTVIDTKFPLSWLIGCSAAIVFTLGGVAYKVNDMGNTLTKIETKSDARDDKTALIQQMVLIMQGENKTQATTIQRAQSDIADLKRDVDELRRNKTWAPK